MILNHFKPHAKVPDEGFIDLPFNIEKFCIENDKLLEVAIEALKEIKTIGCDVGQPCQACIAHDALKELK